MEYMGKDFALVCFEREKKEGGREREGERECGEGKKGIMGMRRERMGAPSLVLQESLSSPTKKKRLLRTGGGNGNRRRGKRKGNGTSN
jgi:hypothetical protein